MIARLFADLVVAGEALEPFERALLAVGACSKAELPGLRTRAAAMTQAAVIGRIHRCVRESSEFRVRRGLLGTRYERRDMPTSGRWVEGGAEFFRYWFGDRTHEILSAAEPVLGACFRPFLPALLSGRHRLFVAEPMAATLPDTLQRLQDGHELYLALRRTP